MADVAELEARVAELEQRLEQEVSARSRLMELTAALNSTLNLGELLPMIMRSAAELLHAETSSLLLVDEETGDLTFEVATGDQDVVKSRVPAGQGIAGWVVEHGEPIVVDDPRADERFYAEIDKASGFETRTILAVPLKVKERVIGVVEVINKQDGDGFGERDLELARALTDQASIAIDNARIYAKLADAVVTSRMSYRL